MNGIKIVVCAWFAVLLLCADTGANELKVLTEDLIPFNYMENNKVTGFTTELVENLLEKTGIQPERGKILLWPWKRAYQTALEEKNVLLFTTTRTPERENLFKWVGPIYPRQQWMFRLRERPNIRVNTLEESKRFKIVVVENSANHQFFIKHGFESGKNLIITNTWNSKINMLVAERADLASYIPLEIGFRLKQIGRKSDLVEKLFLVSGDLQYYLSFSRKTPDDIVKRFQSELDAMKKHGAYQKILDKYTK